MDTLSIAPHTSPKLPDIIVSARQLRDSTALAVNALTLANHPPVLFERAGSVVEIVTDGAGRTALRSVTTDIAVSHMTRTANYFRFPRGRPPKESPIETQPRTTQPRKPVACSPPPEIARNILARGAQLSFPPLDAVTECPFVDSDGALVWERGYHEGSRTFFAPTPGLVLPPVPSKPTAEDLARALQTIEDIIGEFPFATSADRANAYALLLTPLVAPLIDDCLPLVLIDAPTGGTGKGLLARVFSRITTGADAVMQGAPGEFEEEWRKTLTAIAASGRAVVVFDNFPQTETLRSGVLASFLTARTWGDRLLGHNRDVTYPQRALVMVTGNNIRLGAEIPRRSVRIRLDAKVDNPEERASFRHADLPGHTLAQRGKILAALATLIRAWVAGGSEPDRTTARMGSFERWQHTVGGILRSAGIVAFLGNMDETKAAADETEDIALNARFLERLSELLPQRFHTEALSRLLADPLAELGAIPQHFLSSLVGHSPERNTQNLGYALKAWKGKRFNGWHIERDQADRCRKSLWRIEHD